jgi:hypothetical protein
MLNAKMNPYKKYCGILSYNPVVIILYLRQLCKYANSCYNFIFIFMFVLKQALCYFIFYILGLGHSVLYVA